MKRFALYILFFGVSQSSFAQKETLKALEFSINPGINYRWISLKNNELSWLKDSQDNLQKPSAGIGIQINHEFGITEKRSFFAGIAYSRQGYEYKKNSLEGFRTYTLHHHFLQVPLGINAYFRLNERLQFAVQPSLLTGVLISTSAKYVLEGDQLIRKMETYPQPLLISIQAQLAAGISVRIDQWWKFRTNIYFQQQLTAMNKGDLKVRLYNTGIQLGLSRYLGN